MKDSKVRWIGQIPDNWSVIKGKYFLILLSRKPTPNDEVITCFRDGEVTLRSNRREDGFTMSDKEIGYQGIKAGDLVVHGMDGFAGAIGISDSDGKGSPVLLVMDSSENKDFLVYQLRAYAKKDVFVALSTGIRVRSCDLNFNKLGNLEYLVPPLEEQKKIADFLDDKCAQIDEITKDLEEKINKLEEYKKEIVFEAVTKGLSTQVEFKDSGIYWIGKVPSHWKVVKGKYCFDNDKEIVGARVDQFERLALTLNGVIKRSKDDNEGLQPKDFATYQILRKDELVFKLIDLQNISTSRVGLSPYVGLVSPAYIILKSRKNTYPNYAERFYLMMWYNQIFNHLGDDGVRSSLNATELLNLPFVLPPLEEQKKIADFLDDKCAQIDEITKATREEIETLKQYKQSLIYEYVTGKKEVPNE